jgi:predicted ATPase/class 3 adenylate cyclase
MTNLPTGTVTFLFTDIEGSTKLSQQYRDAMPALLARHNQILHQAIERYNGYVFQVVGDSFAAAFHSASDALNAALDAQRNLYNEAWTPAPIKVRMGIHTGAAYLQVDSKDNAYSGYATLASTQRIMSAGHGGQIIVSGATRELVRYVLPKDSELQDLGEKRLKDLLRPEHLYQLNISGLPSTFPPLKTLDAFLNNLPTQLTSFIGRENEIAEVKQELQSYRLVTLTGSGGTGKTRLSLQVAADLLEEFNHGVWFVELAPLTDPDLIPQTILSTIGVGEQAGKLPLEILKEYLPEKKVLIVLDNCEHLVSSSAQVANALLNAAPKLKILASSREALGVKGEASYPVPSLSLPDIKHLPVIEQLSRYEAVRLFIDRALLVAPHFVVDKDNAPFIAQICYRLDGIPLAIELAAARLKMMSVEQISARLDDRFHLLTGGARTALPRQQTLRALIDWSYDLLIENERLLLRRLSVFAGSWTLEAAEKVCVGQDDILPYDILDLLTQLVNKSLVVVMERSQSGETRYRMLETIRQYAREKLLEVGGSEIIRQQHLAYFVDLAEQAEPHLRAFDMVRWLDRLEAELNNIRAALEYALESNIEAELRMASALWWFWHIRGHKSEGADWLERALSIEALERGEKPLSSDRTLIRGKALYVTGFFRTILGELNKGTVLSNESLTLFRELGPAGKRGMAYALHNLAHDSRQQQDTGQAKVLMKESLDLFEEVGDKFGMAQCLAFLGGPWEEDPEMRARMLQEGLALYQEIGDKDGMAITLMLLGDLALWQGDYKKSTTRFEASLALFRELRNKGAMSLALRWLGRATRAQGNYGQAITILEEALVLGQELGDKFPIASSYDDLGLVAQSQGEYERATQLHEDALTLFRELGNKHAASYTLSHLGFAALAQGDNRQAAKKFEQALATSREGESKFGEASALYGLGRAVQSQGNYALTPKFYMDAIVIFREISDPEGVAYCLEGFAVLAITQNQFESSSLRVEGLRRAARLFGAAETLYNPLRFEMSAAERAKYDQAEAAARASLGEEAFAAAWAEGQKMTLEQAVANALEELQQ